MNSPVRVLHVDDEQVICDLTKISLEKGGRLEVDIVNSAQDALKLIQSRIYSCIISDYEMPHMNGLDFLKEVRNFDKNIPFILFSGKGRETVIIDAINTGADFYIQKGGDPKALFAELNHKVQYAIQQRNTTMALKRRDSVLEAVSLVSNLFLGGEPFEKAIKEAITLFGLATEVDAVRMFKIETDNKDDVHSEKYIRNIGSWTRITIHPPDREEYIRNSRLIVKPDLIIPIMKGEPYICDISNILYLDPCRSEIEAKSVAIFPVFVNQSVWGLIWFADYICERNWSGVEIDALIAASSMIGSAIQQDLMKNSLIAAKEEYAEMYSLMRRLCDTVPDILWAKDNKEKFIFVNQAGADFLQAYDTREPVGKEEEEFLKRGIISSQIPIIKNSDSSIQIQSLSGSKTSNYDIITVPFKIEDGKQIGTVTLGRDITRYPDIEHMLKKSRERYESVIQRVHIGIILADIHGTISIVNKRALELMQTTYDKVQGRPLNTIEILNNMNIPQEFNKAIKTGKNISFLSKCEISQVLIDMYCKIMVIVPEKQEGSEILITLDPHYTT
ncbi:MAG: response regulator [Methanomicrobiales archaeon]|nr:response regulator [Methanomicrobiales archaeon]